MIWLAWDWYQGDNALIPLSVIGVKAAWSAALTQCLLFTIIFYASFFLPMYLQAVQGKSPVMSGVFLLPSIGSQTVTTMAAGYLCEKHLITAPFHDSGSLTEGEVQRTGYVIPLVMLSGTMGAISNGLYSTFSPATTAGTLVGFQIFNGVGRGLGMQMVLIANPYDKSSHL